MYITVYQQYIKVYEYVYQMYMKMYRERGADFGRYRGDFWNLHEGPSAHHPF